VSVVPVVGGRYKNGATPLNLATDDACRAILEHHTAALATIEDDPATFLSSLVTHCAALSASKKPEPETVLSLHEYQLDPSFFWATPTARCTVFAWAQDTSIAHIAVTTQPFKRLPGDCAGDVLEYFDTTMTRMEMMKATTHNLSSEAHAWVREILAAAIAVRCTILSF
jgi:hypothetical protein